MLRGSWPVLSHFDVVEPRAGVSGNEIVADYIKQDSSSCPAGVAYTHQTLGYQTVNLGFGMEFMVDGKQGARTLGYFNNGIEDRVDLFSNIMDYFGKASGEPGTGIAEGEFRNELSFAHPNPFNPVTRITYSVKDAGRVTIEVYNVAGKVVRTLLDTDVEAGATGHVDWDGRARSGELCACGVYFYRIAAPGFTRSHKMIMLK